MIERAGIGTVALVGAGPGDPRLITVRGRELLERADVIVYDRLASPRLLRAAKPGAELIYAGKSPEGNALDQEEISLLLVRLAQAGKSVVRLKGGDPSVFARVGEEMELLAANGIPYEIVPGITSALAAPIFAGIPVTYKNVASSFHVISAHEDPDSPETSHDWEAISRLSGTLVFLMGVSRLQAIASQLIQHGRSPQTPVALVRWGTRVEQETVSGTLADIADRVAAARLKNPAVIIVGEVVALRDKIRWVEKRPLFGRRIVVTRSRSQASEMSRLIEELGGEPYEYPVIETAWPDDLTPFDAALANLQEYDWLIFTSVNAVEMFFQRMRHNRVDIRTLASVRIAAVGQKTAQAVERYGLLVEVVGEEFIAEGLLDVLGDRIAPGQKVLFPRADIARRVLPDTLRQAGCDVTEFDAYRTVAVADETQELVTMLRSKQIDVITFTSGSTVKNLCAALEGHDAADLLQGVVLAAIGPQTAKALQERGLPVDVMPDTYTIPALLAALTAHLNGE